MDSSFVRPVAIARLVVVSTFFASVYAQDTDFSSCWSVLDSILTGNTTLGNINNETVGKYLWTGPITGLHHDFPRENITAITYEGCLKMCGNRDEIMSTRSALEIATNWIFPLSILLNLPYESVHQKKFRTTFNSVFHWVGSPQTALTHTIFNVRQTRHCHRMAKTRHGLWNDAFYVLSCLGQFETPGKYRQQQIFHTSLVFGLFRPLAKNNGSVDHDQQYTAELLSTIAFQLRVLRRRGVIPTLASLAIFLIAFLFSLVLAFGDIDGNRTGAPLTLGLIYCWLPVLVIFSIIDRNPVSAERTATLLARWLYNVDAVITATKKADNKKNMPVPKWWTTQVPRNDMAAFRVGEFIGQGRTAQCSYLCDATIRGLDACELGAELAEYEACASIVVGHINGRRPGSWFITAVVSLAIVWVEVMMAFMIAFFTPTFGLGCWSGCCFFYGVLSSLTWGYQLVCKAPGRKGRMVCNVFNFVAFAWLIFLTTLVLIGGFKNCFCSTVQLSYPYLGGYMMFEDFEFCMENFSMYAPWVTASVIGGLVPGIVFVVATLWWMKCQHLWATEEGEMTRSLELANFEVHSDTTWMVA